MSSLAAPAAPAAPGPVGSAAPPQAPASAPAAAPDTKVVLRPIPPKTPKLPGVLDDGPEDATTRAPDPRARDAAGRVVAAAAAGGGNPTPAADKTSPEPAKGIDWELYAEISKVANESGTPWKAQQWLQEQVDAQRAADIAALREEAIENPRREAERQAQLKSTADTLVDSMAAHTNPDGSPAFPEFRDGATAREVGALWQALGADPMLALPPGGAVAAVALYRMARGMDGAAAAPPAPPPTPAHPPA